MTYESPKELTVLFLAEAFGDALGDVGHAFSFLNFARSRSLASCGPRKINRNYVAATMKPIEVVSPCLEHFSALILELCSVVSPSEAVGDAAYPLKLFQRVITVSLETMKIVRALPRLDIVVGGKA